MNKIKRLSAFLICLLTCVSCLNITASAAEIKVSINAVNQGRGENHLIVYTPEFGKSTATNEWGREAVVDADGRIIAITTKGDEEIPQGGFVLSGHGDMNHWIRDNCKVGKYCYYNTRSMTVLVSDTPTEFGGIFYTVETKYHKQNAVRGENMMILFTGTGKTDTNYWGYEVAVDAEGRVIQSGGNDSKIPQGGFVLSGHGTSAEWLSANVEIGMKAVVDTASKTVSFEMDEQAYFVAIGMKIDELKKGIADGKASFAHYDYDFLNDCVVKMENLQTEYGQITDRKQAEAYLDSVNSLSLMGMAACTESPTVQYRGAWLRPVQTTRQEVSDYVQRLYDNGINVICIETFYNSTLICPPPPGSDWEQNPIFGGFDVLEAYVEECHKRNMELHIWMPVFHSSNESGTNHTRSIWYKNPDWRMINNKGKETDESDSFCFLNPNNPEVRRFLLETYEYLITQYDVDGFELDYIRYPDNGAIDHGYDADTVNGFKNKYGVTPKYDTNASYWDKWVQYRCDIITGFVKEAREMFDTVRPEVLLCADVGDDSDHARQNIYQDYSVWLENGWIDLLKPMSYSLGAVLNTYKNIEKADGKLLAAGIGIFAEGHSGYDCALHTVYAARQGADGVMFFEASAYLAKRTSDYLLESGAFRNKAETPTWNPVTSLELYADYAISRIDEVILPLNGMTQKHASDLKSAILAVKSAASSGLDGVLEQTQKAKSLLEKTAADNAVKKDVEYIEHLAKNLLKDTAPKTYKKGDVGMDGDYDAKDYMMIKRAYLGTYNLSYTQMKLADIDGDGEIKVKDYMMVKRAYLGTYVI